MIARRADELAAAVGGQVIAGDPAAVATGVSIDSRTNAAGEAFFAIAGERHDGHGFVADAVRRGATIAVVHADVEAAGCTVVRVDDTTRSLGALATDERRRRKLHVVGVTGSAGKTTTRALTSAALGARWRTASSTGNFNNQWGLPLSLLRLADDAEAAVLEMGMNHRHEIEVLARIAQPDVGVITNVGTAHIGNLGSKDGIAAAKAELLYELAPGATGVVHAGSPELAPHLAANRAHGLRIVSFGFESGADYVPEALEGDLVRGARFTLRGIPVRLALWGRHAVLNATAALAAAEALGVALENAAPALAAVEQAPGRGRIVHAGGLTLIDEVYNANPSAMEAVLAELAGVLWDGRRIAVLGDMLELGELSPLYHRALGAQAAAAGVTRLFAVGHFAADVADGARGAGLADVTLAPDAAAAAPLVAAALEDGDLLLVKGSRGVHLETVRDAVLAGGAA